MQLLRRRPGRPQSSVVPPPQLDLPKKPVTPAGHRRLSARGKCPRGQPPTAAACRSMPQRQILGAVGGGFEACRSMPQRAKIFTWRTFFSIPRQTSEPFVAHLSQNWMVAQWYMTRCQFEESWVPFLERAISKRAVFRLSVPLYCCTDLRFFGVVLTCQALRILKLPRHHRSHRSLRNPQGTRRQPGVQQIVCSGPLGKVLGTTSASLTAKVSPKMGD